MDERKLRVSAAASAQSTPIAIGDGASAAMRSERSRDMVIAIGSSTGGIEALHSILPRFPTDCPPTLIVQHISGPFAESFVRGLSHACAARVTLAEDGQPLAPGHIYVGPGNSHHLTVSLRQRPVCRLVASPPVSGHRPSIDVLFRSCAGLGPRLRAALLTGMGADGARGLLAIRQAGGRTIAQDRQTSVVFGMARVAEELGAVEAVLPLDRIAAALMAPESREPARARTSPRMPQ